jgi:hypothetical protein
MVSNRRSTSRRRRSCPPAAEACASVSHAPRNPLLANAAPSNSAFADAPPAYPAT